MAQAHGGFRPIPVLYFTQLLGLALGADGTGYLLDRHYVDPRPLLVERRERRRSPARLPSSWRRPIRADSRIALEGGKQWNPPVALRRGWWSG